jgi:NADPH:quinone reductase
MGNYIFTPEEATFYTEKLFTLLDEGKLKVLINKEYPFSAEGVQQAQRDLVEGQTVGKNLIKFI